MDRIDTSGKALVAHWKWAADKGLIKANTAGGLQAACSQVLGALDNWETVDVSKISVDDVCLRFQNKRSKDFKPDSLDTYKRRFANAVSMFLNYAKDPSAWKPSVNPRQVRRKTGNGSDTQEAKNAKRARVDNSEDTLIEYPFPLREGRIAYFHLPADLKVAEVKRLHAYLTTLAIDFNPPASE